MKKRILIILLFSLGIFLNKIKVLGQMANREQCNVIWDYHGKNSSGMFKNKIEIFQQGCHPFHSATVSKVRKKAIRINPLQNKRTFYSMRIRKLTSAIRIIILAFFALAGNAHAQHNLAKECVTPPDSDKPWVNMWWLNRLKGVQF